VLVVDDDPDNVYCTAVLLRLFGHTVETAADGETALAAAAANPPDVVLLDMDLPRMEGYIVARRLGEQQREGHRRMLLIAVTAYGQPADRQRSWEAGMSLYLVKPVDPELLGNILASYANARPTS
jgi:CheY-like chemotaxis protein